jgi:hypothetical protein
MADEDLAKLAHAASLIFLGTVESVGETTVPSVPARPNSMVVRVERGIRVHADLGELAGKDVTVLAREPGKLEKGASAVFFTNSLVHAESLLLEETGRLPAGEADRVAAFVQAQPDERLRGRLADADMVVTGTVVAVTPPPSFAGRGDKDDPMWARAEIEVHDSHKGPGVERTSVLFPTSRALPWYRAPRFEKGQRGLFILSRDAAAEEGEKEPEEHAGLVAEAPLTALDPDDFQPEDALPRVAETLTDLRREEPS